MKRRRRRAVPRRSVAPSPAPAEFVHGPALSLSIETEPAAPDQIGPWLSPSTPPATLPVVATMDTQINQVLEWIVAGNTEHDIRESIAKHYPGVDASMLIARAFMRIASDSRATPEGVIAWTFAAGRHIYKKMVEANDFGGSLKALKFIQDTAVRLKPMKDEDEDKEAARKPVEGSTDVSEAQG